MRNFFLWSVVSFLHLTYPLPFHQLLDRDASRPAVAVDVHIEGFAALPVIFGVWSRCDGHADKLTFAADFRPVVETLAGENFFQNRTFWSAVHVSSRPFFEKFRHLAAGTLAFDPVHDLGKFPTVEDEGKAPIPGVDTLPSL